MRVFVTGATGFVGSAIVAELLNAGHQVVGLARSEAAAAALTTAGAAAHRGALDDLNSLRRAATTADGVIHTAYASLSGDFAEAAETDLRAINAIGEVLAASDRPLVITSATTFIAPGPAGHRTRPGRPGSAAGARVRSSRNRVGRARRAGIGDAAPHLGARRR